MSDGTVYELQKRKGSNNTVHLYDGSSTEAVCSNWLGQPSRNDENEVYEMKIDELRDSEYLIVDGGVVGKICGKCRQRVLGSLFGREPQR